MNIYFSENIKQLRKERDLTQEALADFLGVSFQAVSKWERGESYPDIELLPTIADFFSVSTDDLLGVDKAKNEEEIIAIIEKYDKKDYKGTDGAFGFMTEAHKNYPNDYRIAVRYMQELINDVDINKDELKHKKEIESIYNRIHNYCTDDRIRIWAKWALVHYYLMFISHNKKSEVSMDDLYKIIDTMPKLSNSREVMLSYVSFDEDEIKSGCRNLIEEMLIQFVNAASRFCFVYGRAGRGMTARDIETATEGELLMKKILELFYPDGNYGKCWRYAIYNYGNLGNLYHLAGDNDKAFESLKKCAQLAKHFDTMPNITERHGLFFEGEKLNKQKDVNVYLDTSVCMQMTNLMQNNYPLSDEFKSKPEFQEIIEIMK